MTFGSAGLAFVAGLLSILSPCVLPLLPLVLGAAATEHKMGSVALAVGVAVSFVTIGLFVALIGFSIGLDGDVLRTAAAVLMMAVGLVLVLPVLQMRIAMAGGPISTWADHQIAGIQSHGLGAQFGVGLLLGAVWSPCVGPTLGAASVLAAQGSSLGQVTVVMTAFGIGAGLPLIAIGLLSRQALARSRGWLLSGGQGAKVALGALMIGLGVLIVTGLDKRLETALVDASPDWLTTLTTRF